MSLKRVLALVLALTMIFSLAMPGSWAFAEEDDGIVAVEDEYNDEGIVEDPVEEIPAITEETPDEEEPAAEEIVAEQPAEEPEEEFEALTLEDLESFEATMTVCIGTNNFQPDLATALNEAKAGDEITLLEAQTAPEGGFTIAKSVTIAAVLLLSLLLTACGTAAPTPTATPSPTPTPTPQKVEEVCKHSFQDTVVEPTCLSGGYTTHVCTKCGYSYTDAETPTVGHFYRDGYCIWCGTPLPGGIWWDTTVELSEDLL